MLDNPEDWVVWSTAGAALPDEIDIWAVSETNPLPDEVDFLLSDRVGLGRLWAVDDLKNQNN